MIPLLDPPYQNYEQAYLLAWYIINSEVESQVSNTALHLKTMRYIKGHDTIGKLWSSTVFPLFLVLSSIKRNNSILSKPRDTH